MKQILITLTILSLIACSGDTTKADIAPIQLWETDIQN